MKQSSFYALSFLFTLTSLFLIIVTYGENSRMFLTISVIPFVLGVLKINDIIINNSIKKTILILILLYTITIIFFLFFYDHFFEFIFNNIIKFI